MRISKLYVVLLPLMVGMLLPGVANAQSAADSIYGLHHVLKNLYDEMLPLCSRMIDVGRALAGFAALTYIASRVLKHFARTEPIDMFPLLAPFAKGIVIGLFPAFLALMNGVLEPVSNATAAMGGDSQKAMLWHIQQQEQAAQKEPPESVPGIQGSGQWQKYQQPDGQNNSQGASSMLGKVFSMFNITGYLETAVRWLVGVLYAAAGLCIDTIRTFYLIILAILGPLVIGLSIFPGFEQTLSTWIARYINVYMWLPVANIFAAITGKILENMMTLDQDFFSSIAYIIFMLISIVGYTTVPSVAGYIIQAGGKDTLLHKVSNLTSKGAMAAGKLALMAF